MIRSSKLSLKFITKAKRNKLKAILIAYRKGVNYYIDKLWNNPRNQDPPLEKNTRLLSAMRTAAYNQAKGIISATVESARTKNKTPSQPVFKGSMTLHHQIMEIQVGEKSFDTVLYLTSLKSRKRLFLPVRKTKHLNKLLAVQNAILKQGGSINEHRICVWVELPDLPLKTEGKVIGVDIGVKKLLADSDGNFYGQDTKQLLAKINRKKNGSKAKLRALTERDIFIAKKVKELPWSEIKCIGVEDLTGMKVGKGKKWCKAHPKAKSKRSKQFRKQTASWSYRQVITRIQNAAQLNRVQVVLVHPAKTSQRCPNCSTTRSDNRVGERFRCVSCGYSADADFVGATNVLAKTTGTFRELEVP